MIREVNEDEYEQLMSLYCQLHETSVPEYKGNTRELWQRLVNNPDYHLIASEEDGKIVSTCTCIIVPNMTHGPRPYAFVENVVTDSGYDGFYYGGRETGIWLIEGKTELGAEWVDGFFDVQSGVYSGLKWRQVRIWCSDSRLIPVADENWKWG